MKCIRCEEKAVIELQHGSLCPFHFLDYFEKKVFKTIKKYRLIPREEIICVATSGGKDSLTVLYLTKKYLQINHLNNKLFALVINEGINEYREKNIQNLRLFCKKIGITLISIDTKAEFGFSLDEAYPFFSESENLKPCHVCGIWRRYLLNKIARKNQAKILVTGHNLDDEAQAILMNIFKANTSLTSRLGPKSGQKEHDLFVQRVKPLYFCTEEEVKLYTLLKKFKVNYCHCPYSNKGYRYQVKQLLNTFEQKFPGTKQGIIRSFLALPEIKEEKETIQSCQKCLEPANKPVCNACTMKDKISASPQHFGPPKVSTRASCS